MAEKKVVLVTFHESDNFGTCLQAYALQESIKSIGYECEILNYCRKNLTVEAKGNFINHIYQAIKVYKLKNIFQVKNVRNYQISKKKAFQKFRENNFNYTTPINDKEELYRNWDVNAFICGSDMIWTADRIDETEIFFLGFVPNDIKKISYAPSFGSASLSSPQDMISKYLERFSSISCREKSGVTLIETLCDRKAKWVCDPTLLIEKEDWIKRFHLTKHNNEPILLSYLFEGTPDWFIEAKNKFVKSNKFLLTSIPMTISEIISSVKLGEIHEGPIGFIDRVYQADYVITNSYHGLLFSIIFEKQFALLSRDESGKWSQFEERMLGLLSYLDLNDRILRNKQDVSVLYKKIDYGSVRKKLSKLIYDSKQYLHESLEK